jgi:hypothetical protein
MGATESTPAAPSFHNALDIIADPNTWRAYSDETLGMTLLAAIVADAADRCGLARSEIGQEFVTKVASRLLQVEAHKASNIALEKASHKAAVGQFPEAGRLLREDMADRAAPLLVERVAALALNKLHRGPRAAGAKKVAEHQGNVDAVVAAWKRLDLKGVPEHARSKQSRKKRTCRSSVSDASSRSTVCGRNIERS